MKPSPRYRRSKRKLPKKNKNPAGSAALKRVLKRRQDDHEAAINQLAEKLSLDSPPTFIEEVIQEAEKTDAYLPGSLKTLAEKFKIDLLHLRQLFRNRNQASDELNKYEKALKIIPRRKKNTASRSRGGERLCQAKSRRHRQDHKQSIGSPPCGWRRPRRKDSQRNRRKRSPVGRRLEARNGGLDRGTSR